MARRAAAVVVAAVLTVGCNHSRYGVRYDQRLPQLQRIAVVSTGVQVNSLHSGGVLEPRPDLVPGVRDQVLDAI